MYIIKTTFIAYTEFYYEVHIFYIYVYIISLNLYINPVYMQFIYTNFTNSYLYYYFFYFYSLFISLYCSMSDLFGNPTLQYIIFIW